MAEVFKKVREAAVKEAKKAQKRTKPLSTKPLNPEQRSSDANTIHPGNNKQDFLGMLKDELRTPFLGLLEEYSKRCSPSGNKDLGKSMFIFKEGHRLIFRLCFLADFILLLTFVSVVLYVGLRGLQINPFGIIK